MNHLDVLNLCLSNERIRLAAATTESEIALRTVWVAQLDREVAAELAFTGSVASVTALSDDDLLSQLNA